MIKVPTFPKLALTQVPSTSLINFKDYASFVNMLDGNYYHSGKEFLTKLYRYGEIELVNYRFVKNLFYFDKNYALSKIEENIRKLVSGYLYTSDNCFIVSTSESVSSYEMLVDSLQEFDLKYFKSNDFIGSNNEFMVFDKDGNGLYAEVSLINEDTYLTDVTLLDGVIYAKYNSGIKMDKDFESLYGNYLGTYKMTNTSIYFDTRLETNLSWSEYELVLKLCGERFNLEFYPDEERSITYDMSHLQKSITASNHTVMDALKIMTNTLLDENKSISIMNLMSIYEDIANYNLMVDKLN